MTWVLLACACWLAAANPSPAQPPGAGDLIEDVLEANVPLRIDPQRSLLVRTKQPVIRFSITNPDMLEIVQYSPNEFELIGGTPGMTNLTIWFSDDAGGTEVLRYMVRVAPDDRAALEYGDLQRKINELFPNSMVQLIPFADKLIVRGQARDSEEAAQILGILRRELVDQNRNQLGPGSFVQLGTAARPFAATDWPASNIINLLEVPGEHQVMLKVRIAEISRSALRRIGGDLQLTFEEFTLNTMFGFNGPFNAILNGTEAEGMLEALASNSYAKVLAEPNLVTLSGRPARFIAGGEFAVPVVVGIDGAAAATTNFRGFGTQLVFTPTVIDKDRIRLFVAPSFTSINNDNTVDGIPGLDSRAVSTTVDLREGQWLAIAGLIQDQQSGSKSRVPFVGSLPIVDFLFSQKQVTRDESELIVLVSPELVHPLEAKEMPLMLPGMEVTDPTNWEFYGLGLIEGRPGCDFRSTTWPHYWAHVHQARHEARRQAKYQQSEGYYVHGPQGLSR